MGYSLQPRLGADHCGLGHHVGRRRDRARRWYIRTRRPRRGVPALGGYGMEQARKRPPIFQSVTALNADYITSKLPPFTLLDEPELTFKPGNALADVSPLRGLDRHGPYSSASFPLYIPQLRLATLGPAN